MSLYHYPAVYAALFSPDVKMRRRVKRWIRTHLVGPFARVLDPACGPGNWLLPFARKGLAVAGNDLEPAMVHAAKEALKGFDARVLQGDMCALAFEDGAFDVALNLDGSVGHLPDDEAVVSHLQEVLRCLRPGGIYCLGLLVLDGQARETDSVVLFEEEQASVAGGGSVRAVYRSEWRDPVARVEKISLQIETQGVAETPVCLEESYLLRTFPLASLREILEEVSAFTLCGAYATQEQDAPRCELAPNCGDVTLILRKVSEAP